MALLPPLVSFSDGDSLPKTRGLSFVEIGTSIKLGVP